MVRATVVIGPADGPLTSQHTQDRRRSPDSFSRLPDRSRQLLDHAIQADSLLCVPCEHLTDHRRFFVVDTDLPVTAVLLRGVGVSVGRGRRGQFATARPMQTTASASFQDLGTLVFGACSPDLKWPLVVRRVVDRPLAEQDLDPVPLQLLEEQDLIRVAARQTVGSNPPPPFEATFSCMISKLVQSWTVEPRPAVAIIGVGG